MRCNNSDFSNYELHYRRMGNKRPAEEIWLPQIKRDFFKPWMKDTRSDAPILDVGCGWGHQLHILFHLGFSNLKGIEIVEDSMEIARQEVSNVAKIELADVFDYLPDRSEQYAVIILNDVLEHIPHERTVELLKLAYHALMPGGIISIRVPNMSSLLASFSMHLDFTHVAGFTEFSLMQVLDQAGFIDHRMVSPRPKLFLSITAPFRSSLRMARVILYLVNKALHLLLYFLRSQRLFPRSYEYNLEMYSHKPQESNAR